MIIQLKQSNHAYYNIALQQFLNNNVIKAYENFLLVRPTSSRQSSILSLNLALCLIKLNRNTQALRLLSQEIPKKTTFFRRKMLILLISISLKSKSSMELAKAFLDSFPQDQTLVDLHAFYLFQKGRISEALQLFQTLVKNQPSKLNFINYYRLLKLNGVNLKKKQPRNSKTYKLNNDVLLALQHQKISKNRTRTSMANQREPQIIKVQTSQKVRITKKTTNLKFFNHRVSKSDHKLNVHISNVNQPIEDKKPLNRAQSIKKITLQNSTNQLVQKSSKCSKEPNRQESKSSQKMDLPQRIRISLANLNNSDPEQYFQLGQLYLKQGKIKKAIDFFQKAVSLNGQSKKYKTSLIYSYMLVDQPQSNRIALKLTTNEADLDQRDFMLGCLYKRLDCPLQLQIICNKNQKDPRFRPMLLQLIKKKQSTPALQQFLYQQSTPTKETALELVKSLNYKDNFQFCQSCLLQLQGDQHLAELSKMELVRLYIQNKSFKKALKKSHELLEMSPSKEQYIILRAKLLMKYQQTQKASKLLEQRIKTSPSTELVSLYLKLLQITNNIQRRKQLLKDNRYDFPVDQYFLHLGNLHYDSNNFEEAEKYFKKVRSCGQAEHQFMKFRLANIAIQKNKFNQALQLYSAIQNARFLNMDLVNYNIGSLLLQLNQFELGLKYLNKVEAVFKSCSFNKALCLERMGRRQECIATIKEGLQLSGKSLAKLQTMKDLYQIDIL